jgi:mono/diheme cytochrome c family protein
MKPILILFIFVIAASCSSRRSQPITGTLPGEQYQRGNLLYKQHCNSCHPGGEAGQGPALNSLHVPAFVKRFQVRHGLGAMPAFKKDKISRSELHDITAYMSALQKQKGIAAR